MLRLTLTAMLLLLPACAAAPSQTHRAEFTRLCMGVPTRIVVYSDTQAQARDAAAAAFDRIAALEQVMSDYRSDSELKQLCRAPSGQPHAVSPDLFEVLSISQQLAEATSGAFDITIGPAVALWRRARNTAQLPTTEELATALSLTGHHLLTLDPIAHTATLAKPNMLLDLGGIGKGYAAQQAVELLQARGHPRCLVALAGDIVVGESPPNSPGWQIDIPSSPPHPITLSSAAISTSGDTSQFVEINGTRYAHILDPHTGLGLIHCPVVTVIAPRGELSDALATAACILGPHRTKPILDRFHASMP